MWLKFKNVVATVVIETFHLLLLTLLLGQTFHVQQQPFDDIVVMASSTATTTTTTSASSVAAAVEVTTSIPRTTLQHHQPPALLSTTVGAATGTGTAVTHITLANGGATKTKQGGKGKTIIPTTLPLLTPTSTITSSASSLSSISLLSSTSLWRRATNASKLLNSTLPTVVGITDSNGIDTLSDDTETESMNMGNNNDKNNDNVDHNVNDYEDDDVDDDDDDNDEGEVFLTKDNIMTKHIALSDDSTRVATSPDMMTSSVSSSSILSKLRTAQQGPQVALVTPKMSATTTTTAYQSRSPASATTTATSLALSSSYHHHHHKVQANTTRLNEFPSLSLLSLNDTSAKLLSSNTAPSATTSDSAAAAATILKGSEQNMHNTNSHLTVDNRNGTIVASRQSSSSSLNTAVGAKMLPPTAPALSSSSMSIHQHQHQHQQQHQQHQQHQHQHQRQHQQQQQNINNSNLTALGHSNKSHSNGISNTSDAITTITGGGKNDSLVSLGSHTKVNGTHTTRISARRVEHKYVLPKSHKTDAPMLNYIFDTFSSANKHHHHDQRYGPHFEDVQLVGKPTNMTVQAGSSIHLNCRISLLQDKTVSWVRRNSEGENALDLLTVGLHAYTGDKRYKMEFQYPNNWRLKISNVKKDDEAVYECQISTHPPRVIQINLHVNAPKVMIVDEFGDPLQEKYYEQDSTLQLSCVVRNVAMSTSVVFWKHSEDVLNYDVTRGGISVKTELMDDGANSTLFIAKINKADSGNYTCSISEYQNYTIVVHILNGESFAELHHGNAICWHRQNHKTWAINLIVLTTILLILPAYVIR